MKNLAIVLFLILTLDGCNRNQKESHEKSMAITKPELKFDSTKGAYPNATNSEIPKKGFVPDKETAINVAKAIWLPVYGQEEIKNGEPFSVDSNDSCWIVTGHFDYKHPQFGNQLFIEIRKKDCKIVAMGLWK